MGCLLLLFCVIRLEDNAEEVAAALAAANEVKQAKRLLAPRTWEAFETHFQEPFDQFCEKWVNFVSVAEGKHDFKKLLADNKMSIEKLRLGLAKYKVKSISFGENCADLEIAMEQEMQSNRELAAAVMEEKTAFQAKESALKEALTEAKQEVERIAAEEKRLTLLVERSVSDLAGVEDVLEETQSELKGLRETLKFTKDEAASVSEALELAKNELNEQVRANEARAQQMEEDMEELKTEQATAKV